MADPSDSSPSVRHRIPGLAPTCRMRICWLGIAALVMCCGRASAQIGTDICGCQPATYTFTFDFDLTCDDTTVMEGGGVNETACLTEIRGQDEVPPEDLVPLSVQNVQIFELDQDLQVVAQTVRTGPFANGGTFTYTSIISTMTSDLNSQSLPRGLQVVSTGLNAKEEATVNTYIITYTNDCGIFPILTEGQQAGWTVFTDLGDPPQSVCPVAPSPAPTTLAPNVPPATDPPTDLPPPTGAPSLAPMSLSPNVQPSTDPPTGAPVPTQPPNTRPPHCPPTSSKGVDPPPKNKPSRSPSSKGKGGKGMKKKRSKGKGVSMHKLRSGKGKGRRNLGTGQDPIDYDECPEYNDSSDKTPSSNGGKGGGKGRSSQTGNGGKGRMKKKRESEKSMKRSMLTKRGKGGMKSGLTDSRSDSRSRREGRSR